MYSWSVIILQAIATRDGSLIQGVLLSSGSTSRMTGRTGWTDVFFRPYVLCYYVTMILCYDREADDPQTTSIELQQENDDYTYG